MLGLGAWGKWSIRARTDRLARRIGRIIEDQVNGTPWEVFNDWGVETPVTVRYGDVVVSPAGEPGVQRWTAAPVMVVEVLSPLSADRDLDDKPAEYLAMPSVRAYVVVSQTQPACLVWLRGDDGTFAAGAVTLAPGDNIRVGSLGLAVAIDDIYRDIEISSCLRPHNFRHHDSVIVTF